MRDIDKSKPKETWRRKAIGPFKRQPVANVNHLGGCLEMKKLFVAIVSFFLSFSLFSPLTVSAKAPSTATLTPPVVYTGVEGEVINDFYSYSFELYAGQTTSAGTVLVSNDVDTLFIDIDTVGILGEVHVYLYTSLSALPTKRPAPGLAPYVVQNINDSSVSLAIDVVGLADGVTYYLAIHAAFIAPVGTTDPVVLDLAGETAYAAGDDVPNFTGKGAWYYIIGYTVKQYFPPVDPEEPTLTEETAWAFGGLVALEFDDLGITTRWGWTNGPLPEGLYTFDIYAAAGNNVLANGTLVGELTVDYQDGVAVVTYTMFEGFTLEEVHLYVGNDLSVIVKQGQNYVLSAAPGQFPYTQSDITLTSYTFVVSDLEGAIYVAAHAVVSGDYSN